MATFALICIDKPGSLDLRLSIREAHFDYVRANPGVVRLGGPFLGPGGEMAGSLILIEATDLAAAQAFSDHDPYTLAGLFQSRDIKPWRCTFGALP
jgi:uncharacterized protein YciI